MGWGVCSNPPPGPYHLLSFFLSSAFRTAGHDACMAVEAQQTLTSCPFPQLGTHLAEQPCHSVSVRCLYSHRPLPPPFQNPMPILRCPPADPRVDLTLCVIPEVSRGPRSLLHPHCRDAEIIVWGERLEGASARSWVTALGEVGQEPAGSLGLARSIPAPTLTRRTLQPGLPCPCNRGQIRGWVYSQASPLGEPVPTAAPAP